MANSTEVELADTVYIDAPGSPYSGRLGKVRSKCTDSRGPGHGHIRAVVQGTQAEAVIRLNDGEFMKVVTEKKPNWHREPFMVTRPAIRTNPAYDLHFDPNKNKDFIGIEVAPGSLEEEHARLRGKVIDLESTVSDLAAEVERLKNPDTVKVHVTGKAPDRLYDFRVGVQAEAERQIKVAEDLAWRFANQRTLADAVYRWLADNGYMGEPWSASVNQHAPWRARVKNRDEPWKTIDIPEADRSLILAEVGAKSK